MPDDVSQFDPDRYRMSLGEHLEELRRRLLLALLGVVVVGAVCLYFGDRIFLFLCKPLVDSLQQQGINPQMHLAQVGDAFMLYIKISIIAAIALAGPWIVYQLWQFLAAGLYPKERKYITRYVPLSVALMITGMMFVYYFVLPWTLQFFLFFSNSFPFPAAATTHPVATSQPVMQIPVIPGNPSQPLPGQIWFNSNESRLKFFNDRKVMVISYGPDSLFTQIPDPSEYIDMVLMMLLTFGLCFQSPLVVLALVKIGLVEIATFRSMRRYVYFGLTIVAAVITPGDVITATLALVVPLVLLYELGILLAAWSERKAAKAAADS